MQDGTLRELELDPYLVDCVKVEPLAITEEMVRLPADLAYWNERFARAHEQYLRAKAAYENVLAQCQLECREALAASGVKATESAVEARVQVDRQHQDAKMALIEAEVARVRTRGVVDAVTAKKDMLQSLGAHLRAEMEGDPITRKLHREFGQQRG